MLLGAAGRVMVARDGASTGAGDGQLSPSAAKAIGDADLTVIAPGHFEEEIRPVLGIPGVIEGLSRSHAPTVAVTKVMTGENDGSPATTSHEVAQLTEYVKSCPRIEGCQEIILPGDPERRLAGQRMREGVSLDDENWNALLKLGQQLGVATP